MKVLLSAYACEPGRGSEPEIGWQWANRIAKSAETWVITRANNRPSIEAALDLRKEKGTLRFIYLDAPEAILRYKKGNKGIHWYYPLWQLLAARSAIKLHHEIGFDLAHHVTFVNDWMGPGLAWLDVPFVWGPIGSNPFVQPRHWKIVGPKEIGVGVVRQLLRRTGRYRDPSIGLALRRAKKIIVINNEVYSRLPRSAKNRAIIFSQNAVNEDDMVSSPKSLTGPLRIISVGQLIGIKAFPLTIQAFSIHLRKHSDSVLTIVGEGPEMNLLQKLSSETCKPGSVRFTGKLDRKSVLNIMSCHNLFLFPSMEGGGMVVLEAMAKGLPVVCLDFGGPSDYVTEECGVKVGLDGRRLEDRLAEALNAFCEKKIDYKAMSAAAIERIKERYTWKVAEATMRKIYREALGLQKDFF